MNQPVKHQNSVAIRCKLLLASNWPPNSSVASKNQLFPQWQAQRTFFGRPWAKSASAARLCGFFHRPPTAFDFRHLPLTSKTRQFLKIKCLRACRFESGHRHHVVADSVSFATAFSFSRQTPSLIHSVTPPFRKRSRPACLLGCKRPRHGSLSLPAFCGFQSLSLSLFAPKGRDLLCRPLPFGAFGCCTGEYSRSAFLSQTLWSAFGCRAAQ